MTNTDPGPPAQRHAAHALVVEDDATSRRVLELILESKGMTADFAEDGAEGLAAFARRSFDVVFMDLQMPRMNGFDAIRGIRAVEAASPAPRTPVVVVSAYSRGEDLALAAAVGADRHIAKPLNVQQLLGAIDELVTA